MFIPEDDNGDVLRRLAANGDDLTRSRNIDFTVVFPDEGSAKQFAEHFRALGYAASSELSEVRSDLPWDVVVTRNMIPSHRAIGEFEDLLQEIADRFGGLNDGWGCLSVPVAN
jgi:hypothetical protein